MMTGYTLLEEIKGINSNALFQLLPGRRFIIHPDFARHRDQLIREFARVAALGDLLRKDDRIIVQALHTEYDANYMVNLERLGKPGRDAVYTIDHNHLFARSNYSLLQDIKYARCTEIGIVSAFEPFYTNPTGREDMLARYEKTYLEQWEKIVSRRVPLSGLIAHNYGPDSKEYKVFQQSLRSDPRKEFADQKAELLGTLSET
jgi:hypothetical protein